VDIVLGVSMTPATVRMVLVEGESAGGLVVDHDVFDISDDEGAANSSPTQQVMAAIVGTRESADACGHRLVSTGVVWSNRTDAAILRQELDIRGIEGVMLVSELHAAGALAKAVGRAFDHDKTGLLFIEGDTATLSVVHTEDGSIVKVETRNLHSVDALAVVTKMVTSLEEESSPPDGIYLLGSGLDLNAVKEHLQSRVTIPLSAPKEPELALARGAALASATAPEFDPLTVGIAYSQDLDGPTDAYSAAVGGAISSAGATLGNHIPGSVSWDPQPARRPFLLVGSTMTAIFVVGVVALVISLAINIRPAVDARPNPGESVVAPTITPPAPPAVRNPPAAQPAPAKPSAAPPVAEPPAPLTIPEPVPVVQQAPEVVQPPARSAPIPGAAPQPAPEAPPPAPVFQPPAVSLPPGLVVSFPPFIGFGPGPSYEPPVRQYAPPWYPPQQQWPRHSRHGGDD
jgi:hypothetical protein